MKRQILNLAVMAATVFTAQAQMVAPGAVGTPEVWFVTTPETDDANGKYKWTDISAEPSVLLRANSAEEASAKREDIHTYNFYPALPFDSTVSHQFTVKGTDLPQRTIIGVFGGKLDDLKSGSLYGLKNPKGRQRMMSRTNLIYVDNDGVKFFKYDGMSTTSREETQRVKVLSYLEAEGSKYSLWGRGKGTTISIGGAPIKSLWTDKEIQDQEELRKIYSRTFYSPEFLVFGRALPLSQRVKVETYLALKYGITLSGSYISHSYMLWDISTNGAYKNRIAGYGRDSIANFYQQSATTAYEENDVNDRDRKYNILKTDDTYHNSNSYNQSSKNNLIVVGFESMAEVEDNTYVLYADNGGSLSYRYRMEKDVDYTDTLKPMGRTWKVRTYGMEDAKDKIKTPLVEINNIDTTMVGLFSFNIKSKGSKETGTVVTNSSLAVDTGSISFSVVQSAVPYIAKFYESTLSEENIAGDYGCSVSKEGKLGIIADGKTSEIQNVTIRKKDKIEVLKQGKKLIVRVNSDCVATATYEGEQKPSAAILIKESEYTSTDSPVLRDVRFTGFEFSGHRVELAYCLTKDSIFMPTKSESLYLLVSEDPACNFKKGSNFQKYLMSENDLQRKKAIFDNVIFSEECYFTFACVGAPGVYTKEEYDYEYEIVPPSCNKNDGVFTLNLPKDKDFVYTFVTTDTTKTPIQVNNPYNGLSNVAARDKIEIKGLGSGGYRIMVLPAGNPPFNFAGSGIFLQGYGDIGLPTQEPYKSSMEYIIANTEIETEVGFKFTDTKNDKVDCGFHVENGSISVKWLGLNTNTYQIEIFSFSDNSISVKTGDRLKIERDRGNLSFYINDKKVATRSIYDYLAYQPCRIFVKNNDHAVQELKFSDNVYLQNGSQYPVGLDPWKKSFLVKEMDGSTDLKDGSAWYQPSGSFEADIVFGGCKGDIPQEEGYANVYVKNKIIYVEGNYKEDAATHVYIYNIHGQRVGGGEFMDKEFEFYCPAPVQGIYFVKIIRPTGETTTSVVVL